MHSRNVGRFVCMLAICLTAGNAVVSCGSSGNSSIFNPNGGDGSSAFDGTGSGGDSTTSSGDDGPSLVPMNDGSGSSSGGGSNDSGTGCLKSCTNGQDCGKESDGCGGLISCGVDGGTGCSEPGAICGGGGPNKCGVVDGSTQACVPLKACPSGMNCGFQADNCGGVLTCGPADGGSACASPQYCGGGGFNVCGGNNGLTMDGSVPCTPTTACTGGQNCGFQGNGCGGVIACGTCTAPAFCGGGGFNICGGNSGVNPDGAPICKPLTCADQKLDCGPAGDGCGNLIQSCGTCVSPSICGGAGVPGNCGDSQCTGLCQQQVNCDGGTTTTISGTVVAGTIAMFGTPDPVPDVLVYVPNGTVQPFTPNVQCSQCGGEVSGDPLVQTKTAYDGTFTLTNVPAGTNIPVVIQLGRWRRQFKIASVPACSTTPNVTLQMPQTSFQGDIPLTAISTGSVDSIECVLLKMGVDQSEFTTPATGGRIQIYEGNGASVGTSTPAETALMAAGGSYMDYDQILFPCWGGEIIKPAAELANLVSYANAGGHFFATHFSYTWLFENTPFNGTANWNVNYGSYGSGTAQIQVPPVNPNGTVFTDWLKLVGAVPTPPNVTIENPRHDVNSVNAPSTDWISGIDPGDKKSAMLYHYTFDTPVGDPPASQCGHAIFSDFHVTNSATSSTTIFPSECLTNETTGKTCTTAAPCPMTAQEKILEYMIWDLAQCVGGTTTPPSCTPLSCQQQNITCGPAGDGCGNEIQCGTCTPPQTCGGGGTPGACGAPDGGSCTPKTCAQQNITCGPAGDGCGNEIASCGTCTPPQTCGGGGSPGQCGYPDAGACVPQTCSDENIFCGPAGDGCGNEIMCGTCTPPETCGGGGVSGQCGSPDAGSCAPTSCKDQGLQCGSSSDGCGNVLNCGTCTSGFTCSGGKCVGAQ